MEFVIATGNAHKLEEFARMLAPLGHTVTGPKQLGLSFDPEETGETFAQNAQQKAMALYQITGKPCVADDSGLCVDALDGAPGIYSARYSGGDDAANREKLLDALKDVPDEKRTAHFACALCCVVPPKQAGDPPALLHAYGVCPGKIDTKCQGEQGFGYDSLFLQDEVGCFGLATPQQKDQVSHRSRALAAFLELLTQHKDLF